jgi:hypothetical protein
MMDELSKFVEEQYRAAFEKGVSKAGYDAALFCLANRIEIPEWLAPLVEEALRRDYLSSEGRGRGAVNPKRATRKAQLKEFISFEVDRLSSLGIPKVKAFERVAQDLGKHNKKYWTAEMVKAEYYRNQK